MYHDQLAYSVAINCNSCIEQLASYIVLMNFVVQLQQLQCLVHSISYKFSAAYIIAK